MDLNQEIWNIIDATPKIPLDVKKSLYLRLTRAVEHARSTPIGRRHGVTIMTQEASLAGDNSAQDRNNKGNATDPKPKSV